MFPQTATYKLPNGTILKLVTDSWSGRDYRHTLVLPDGATIKLGNTSGTITAHDAHNALSTALRYAISETQFASTQRDRQAAPVVRDMLIETKRSGEGDTYQTWQAADGTGTRYVICDSKSGAEYRLTKNRDGFTSCTCPSQKRGGRDYCRHADFVRTHGLL